MVPLTDPLYLAATLFVLAMVGLIANRHNLVGLLMCLELLLLAVNTQMIAFSHHFNRLSGDVFVFFTLAVAASEAAIGLAILVLLYRQKRSIAVDDYAELQDREPTQEVQA